MRRRSARSSSARPIARGGSIRDRGRADAVVGAAADARRSPGLDHRGRRAGRFARRRVPIAILRQWLDDDADGRTTARAKAAVAADHKRLDTFQRWGLKTLGEIAALPAADLSERMGQEGLALQRLARGLDTRAARARSRRAAVRRVARARVADRRARAAVVRARAAARAAVGVRSSGADRGAAAIRLDLRLVDRTTHERVLLLPAAMRDPRVLRTLLLLDLESHPPSAADRHRHRSKSIPRRRASCSIRCSSARCRRPKRSRRSPRGSARWWGRRAAARRSLLDTHRPDGFEMRRLRSPLDSAAAQTALSGAAVSAEVPTGRCVASARRSRSA